MDVTKIPAGLNPPEDINVIIEVARLADPVKYELDKESGAMYVDRFLHTAMHYPCNYGFIPHTLSDDGDPADVMLLGRLPVMPGAVVRACPIGVLMMEDEAGMDEKILCVPHPKLKSLFSDYKDISDATSHDLNRLEHFFAHYKDLEEGKWVKILGWENAEKAREVIQTAVENYNKSK